MNSAMNEATLAAINLVGVLLCAAWLAHASARVAWRRGGFAGVAFAIIVWGLIWLVPQAVSAFAFNSARTLDGIWFANWLVSAFATVLLARSVATIARQLDDSARLDGLGAFGAFRHVVLPFVKPVLWVVVVFTVMAMSIELLAPFLAGDGDRNLFRVLTADPRDPAGIGKLAVASLVMSLVVIAIAFFASRSSPSLTAEQRVR